MFSVVVAVGLNNAGTSGTRATCRVLLLFVIAHGMCTTVMNLGDEGQGWSCRALGRGRCVCPCTHPALASALGRGWGTQIWGLGTSQRLSPGHCHRCLLQT